MKYRGLLKKKTHRAYRFTDPYDGSRRDPFPGVDAALPPDGFLNLRTTCTGELKDKCYLMSRLSIAGFQRNGLLTCIFKDQIHFNVKLRLLKIQGYLNFPLVLTLFYLTG